MRSPRSTIRSGEKVRLPPINSLPSQQLHSHQPIMSRGSPPQDEPDGGSSTDITLTKMSKGPSVTNQETNRGSPTDPAPGAQTTNPSSSVERLPRVPRQTSLVSVDDEQSTEQAPLKRPSITLPSQAQLKLTRRSTFRNTLLNSLPVVSQPDTDKVEDGQETLELPRLPEPNLEQATESVRASPSPQVYPARAKSCFIQ